MQRIGAVPIHDAGDPPLAAECRSTRCSGLAPALDRKIELFVSQDVDLQLKVYADAICSAAGSLGPASGSVVPSSPSKRADTERFVVMRLIVSANVCAIDSCTNLVYASPAANGIVLVTITRSISESSSTRMASPAKMPCVATV